MAINITSVEKRIEELTTQTGDPVLARRAGITLQSVVKTNNAIEAANPGWNVDLTDGLIEGGVEIDSSVSMQDEYSSGRVQGFAELTTAFYSVYDANGKFPVGFFGSTATKTKELTKHNYKGWVANNVPRLSATNLFAAIYMGAEMAADSLKCKEILKLVKHRLSGWDKDQVTWDRSYRDLRPVKTGKIFHFTIITDGAPTAGPGKRFIRELITRLSFCGIFIKFIFVGRDRDGEQFLDDLDDMKTRWHAADPKDEDVRDDNWEQELRYIDNVDKVKFPGGLRSVTDDGFADAMNQEFHEFVPSCVKRELLAI